MKTSVVTLTLNPAIDKTITIPSLEVGGLNRVKEARMDPGGKGVNVAKVLNKFHVEVNAAGFIAGQQGVQLISQLKDRGIDTSFVEVDGETRINLKVVDKSTNVTTEINEPGFKITEEHIKQMKSMLNDKLEYSSILVIGGSLPAGAPSTLYQELVAFANEKQVRVILDADGIALKEGLKANPYAIKPNLYELEKLVERKLETMEEIVEAGHGLLNNGLSLLVVSMGEKGSLIMTQEEAYQMIPFPITPKSTVGAGDSMVATIAYSLLQQKSVEEIGIWATTAGTITASKPGTEVCTLEEVQQHIQDVKSIRL